MTPEQIADCRADLLTFTQTMFHARKGLPMKPNWHQGAICDALERVVLGDTTRLIINIPPRSGKTELAVINFIAWCMGNFPESEFIHASYSKRLATNNTYNARAVMQHEKYAEIFGPPVFQDDSNAKDEFRTGAGGIVYATGAEGTITGYGAGGMGDQFKGAIIIDDPHKAGEGSSDTMRQNVIDWFSTTMESRKNNPNTPIIVIMQRLHENDLSGFLLAGGNGENWEHLKIPAVVDNESFWTEQFPIDDLKRLEKSNAYRYAGQYMQEPSPISGGMFKPGMIEIVDALPAGLKFTRGWDLAASKDSGDWTAGGKVAILDGVTYIADVVRVRGSPDEVERLVVNTCALDGKGTQQSLPQDPGQAGKSQAAYLSKKLNGVRFEFTTETGDKATRASPFASQVNAGNVKMLRGDWNDALIHEMRTFPMGTNDDQIDCLSRAYNKANTSSGSFFTQKRRRA